VTNIEAIKTAYDVRELDSKESSKQFNEALRSLEWPIEKDKLIQLHKVFYDDTKSVDVLWNLVHALESFPKKDQIDAFLCAIPEMGKDAEEWVEILLTRILNDDECADIFKRTLKESGNQAQSEVRKYLSEIAKEKEDPLSATAHSLLKETDRN